MTASLPKLAVMRRFAKGVDALAEAEFLVGDDVPEILEFTEVFEREFDYDAHVVTYRLDLIPEEFRRRINKLGSGLAELRDSGRDLVADSIGIDVDNPGHVRWEPGTWNWSAFVDKLADLVNKGCALAGLWAVAYPTQNGARLFYLLDRPLPVDELEPFYQGVIDEFARWGFTIDATCRDWTRLFRLPKVIRDGRPTWQEDYFQEAEGQLENRLEVDSIKRVGPNATVYGPLSEGDRWKKPSPEEAKALLEAWGGTKPRPTEWAKEAKRRLKNRSCYPFAFEGKLLESGGRDNGIHEIVGQAIALLMPSGELGMEATTRDHIYALFLDLAEQLQPDRDTPDWTDVLYRAVDRYWRVEESKREQERRVQEDAVERVEQDACSLQRSILNGMREWCKHWALHQEEEFEVLAWVREHLIACVNGQHYVMTPKGRYDAMGVGLTNLPSRVRELGMRDVIQLEEPNSRGDGMVAVHPRDLITRHGTNVSRVRGEVEIDGAYVQDLGEPHAAFVFPMFRRRRDLVPEFSKDVDEWLHVFAGKSYELLVEWISWSLAFDEGPICALSIAGPPGVGKKLLVKGLAECLNTLSHATGSDLVGTHSVGLLESCYLAVNEGFPVSRGSVNPADSFRRLVSGEVEPINPKFKSPVSINNPVRVILTANNLDAVGELAGGKDLTAEDQQALGDRLRHIEVNAACADWLNSKPADFTEGWIKGDGNKPSKWTIAKHFLHLYNQRGKRPGRRFLVDGDRNAQIMQEFAVSATALPVIDVIVDMLNAADKNKAQLADQRYGLAIEDGKLFLRASCVRSFAESKSGRSKHFDLSHKKVGSVLRSISVCHHSCKLLKSRAALGPTRWTEINISLLLGVAQHQLQKPCRLLSQLVEGGEVTKIEALQAPAEAAPETGT